MAGGVSYMKQQYIPLDKQSKRKQKEHHAQQRRDWGVINPVTKKVENGKAYNRKKSNKGWCDYEPRMLDFLVSKNHLQYISIASLRNTAHPGAILS